MRISIEKLRIWIVLLGVSLILALVAFFVYARYSIRHIGRDLPQKMGLEIQQSTNNFTISKSSKGRTLFVLHAAKAVQYKNAGRAVLHDVSIELYGTDGSPTDRITGSEFDYDPSTKTVRADGAVDILISDPRAQGPGGARSQATPGSDPKTVHVKTQGLVFDQQTQIASTTQTLTFLQDGSSGSARGATYDGSKGTLSLTSDVVLNTLVDGSPARIEARSAGFDRNSRQMFLIQESMDFQQKHGSSNQATIFFRPDGKMDHIRAEGQVHLRSEDGSDLQGSIGTVILNTAGMLQEVEMNGGLLFVSQGPVHTLHVNSNSGTFSFVQASGGGNSTSALLRHARLQGAVSAVDQQTGLGADVHGSETRETRAAQLDVDLKSGPSKAVEPESVLAAGNAEVMIHTIHANAPQQITRLSGDQIFSTLANGRSISTLRATGNASLEQSTPGGLSQQSHGDVLSVDFAAASSSKPATTTVARNSRAYKTPGLMNDGSQIRNALLSGHAVLVQQRNSSADSEKTVAHADQISYLGDTGIMKLTGGNPHLSRGQSDIAAASIEFNHSTGDATAGGGVKASYVGSASSNPGSATPPAANDVTHVVADHASLDHAKDETTFYGVPTADARMWQGSNSISAPRIVLSRSLQSLFADGGVKANLVANTNKQQGAAKPGQPRLIRATSRSLVYSGGERKLTLTGGVQAHEAEGMISAATVDLYLEQAANPAGSAVSHVVKSSPGPGGQVSRMVAQQKVRLTQGDRTGSGEKLIYTADDGNFILTGTTAVPPVITDREHGTVTGSSLIFNDRDDSVVVNRGQSPTSTDSRTKSDPHSKNSIVTDHLTGTVQ